MITSVTEKRLRNELKDLKKNKLDFAQAYQDDDNKFLFYFLLVGDVDEEDPKDRAHSGQYKNGYYIGQIILPPEYPEKPGDFVFMTPSGRFKVGQKICLSNTGYHKESWSPIWSIRNMLLGLVSIFFSDKPEAQGANHLQMSKTERLKLAKESIDFNIKNHKNIFIKFDQFINDDYTIKSRTPEIITDTNTEVKKINVVEKNEEINDKINKKENDEDDDEYMKQIMEQLKQKDEEEARLKKKQEDEYMEQMMKRIEEDEKMELLKEVKKIEKTYDKKKYNDDEDFYIIDEPEEKPKKSSKPLDKTKKQILKTTIDKSIPDKPTLKIINNKSKIDDNSINEKIEIIKKMTLKTYDYKVFKDVNNLLGLNLNEL